MKIKNQQFTVNVYRNRSGSVSWRVYGRKHKADGTAQIIRENYPSQREAAARQAELQIEALGVTNLLPLLPTRLSAEQLAGAERAIGRLGRHSLDFVVDHFLRTWKPAQVQRTVEAAVAEFIAAKTAKKLRPDSLRNLNGRVKGLLAAHRTALMNEITPANIAALVNRTGWSAQQSGNERRVLVNFFGWCVRQKYTPDNPCDGVDAPVIEHGEPAILTLEETRKLLVAALAFEAGALVPFVVFSLFCGLRPSEVARLQWANVDLAAGTITITSAGTKTRSRRIVKLEANVAGWLAPHPNRTPIQPARSKWAKLRAGAGFDLSKWVADVLRHTAVSNHVARHNEGLTSKWAGHSIAVLHKHYRGVIKEADAEVFWTLTPDNATGAPVPMSNVA